MSRIQPAMADSRCFTQYVPACQVDQVLAARYGVSDQTSYRMSLQRDMTVADKEQRKLYVCERTNPKSWLVKTSRN